MIGLWAQTACIWEVSARKAGDVNRLHNFDTLHLTDFLVSAAAFAPLLDTAHQWRVGETVLEAVRTMRAVTGKNPYLGTILLLTPLAAVPPEEDLRAGVARILGDLDVKDSRLVYEAIRLAQPSGLGSAREQDVWDPPTLPLQQVMALAANRDLVARQYTNGFQDVFDLGVPTFTKTLQELGNIEGAILTCQLHWLAQHSDSLIARKRGLPEATEASRLAQRVLSDGWPGEAATWMWRALDNWMRREPGRNPGTTADLVVACLFVALRSGILTVPPTFPWACDLIS